MKKSRGSSACGARVGKNEKGIKSKKIDVSDIPELSDNQLSSMRRLAVKAESRCIVKSKDLTLNATRAGRSSHAIGRSSKRTWSMSRKATPLLVEDIWEAIEKIER